MGLQHQTLQGGLGKASPPQPSSRAPASHVDEPPRPRSFSSLSTLPIPHVTMTIDSIVNDPALRSFLQTSQHAREQALGLANRLAAISAANTNAPLTTNEHITLSKEQKLLNTNLSHLRGLHRAAYLAARDTKAQTADARHEVDVLHLQLQNLYYEQRHLQSEIAACETHE
jgi:THO complex subunit 5